MQQEYDFLPFVFTETLYYIDEIDSEWSIPITEHNFVTAKAKTASQLPQVNQLKSKKASTQQERLAYMGHNRKGFLILVEDSAHEFLAQPHSELVSGILRAGSLSLADVAIVNIAQSKITFLEMYEMLNPNYVLSFGVNLSQLGLSYQFDLYQPKTIKTITWLIAENLDTLQQSKQKKFALWQALKQLDCYKG